MSSGNGSDGSLKLGLLSVNEYNKQLKEKIKSQPTGIHVNISGRNRSNQEFEMH